MSTPAIIWLYSGYQLKWWKKLVFPRENHKTSVATWQTFYLKTCCIKDKNLCTRL